MKFWDSSAIVPLVVAEATTREMQRRFTRDHEVVVWWGTELECVSAVARLEREGELSPDAVNEAAARLDALATSWNEVEPGDAVRRAARRLLRVHPLRAADSLQLAAALVASEGHPETLEIVTLDERLTEAARREGFTVTGGAT